MNTRRANRPRCRREEKTNRKWPWLYAYFALQVLFFVLCLFIRTEIQLGYAGKSFSSEDKETIVLSDGKEARIRFDDASAKVMDSFRFDSQERFEICSYILKSLDGTPRQTNRSIQSMEAELSLHAYAYRLGIEKGKSKDADLDYSEDPRWYVRMATSLFEVAGL